MQPKKRPEKILPVPELRSQVTEILVANGRSFQPFIRTFHYTGENITKSNLGTLIGVFEIDEMSDDCAYIVNFLASVAKKEYFSNSRRGAIESFEAALHKINLALSELVKHGNVSWLGKFHGTLGVLEKNNIHFSVTGQAAILLVRNDGISDISAGLASEESHIHPIKTFVEVSSGRLNLDDRVLLTSPELLALFSLEELVKNVRRMDNEQFMQFLKTALVNELDMAGTILVDVAEEVIVESSKTSQRPSPDKALERVSNIFSQSAFLPKKPSENASPNPTGETPAQKTVDTEELDEEYIDTKTGHIYVQGDTLKEPGKNEKLDHLLLGFEEFVDTAKFFLLSQGKWFRKGKKQLLLITSLTGETLYTIGRRTRRVLRRQWRTFQTPKKTPSPNPFPEKKASEEIVTQAPPKAVRPVSDIPLPEKPPVELKQEVMPSTTEESRIENSTTKDELPSFLKEKLDLFYKKEEVGFSTPPMVVPSTKSSLPKPNKTPEKSIVLLKTTAQSVLSTLQRFVLALGSRTKNSTGNLSSCISSLAQKTAFFWKEAPVQKKRILFGIGASFVLLLTGWYFWPVTPLPTTDIRLSESPSLLESQIKNVPSTDDVTPVLEQSAEPIVGSVILNEETYVVTKKNIISLTEKKSYPLPNKSSAQFTTTMDDLRLVFIVAENNTLYAWSPISKTFVENTLALADNVVIAGIDTYLTYLYVLDSNNDQVYRFPRADGGFGAGTPWLKDSLAIDTASRLAVNESLYIALDTHTLKGFFRGREGNSFEAPGDLAITDLYTHPGLQNVYALDAEHSRIIIWNQDGKLLKELGNEKFSEGQTLSVNEKDNEIFISTEDTLLSYKLK